MFTFYSAYNHCMTYVSQAPENALEDQKPTQSYTTNKHEDIWLSVLLDYLPPQRGI